MACLQLTSDAVKLPANSSQMTLLSSHESGCSCNAEMSDRFQDLILKERRSTTTTCGNKRKEQLRESSCGF